MRSRNSRAARFVIDRIKETGVMEYWSAGVMDRRGVFLHDSNSPTLHHSAFFS
jgi:hypothetical protein